MIPEENSIFPLKQPPEEAYNRNRGRFSLLHTIGASFMTETNIKTAASTKIVPETSSEEQTSEQKSNKRIDVKCSVTPEEYQVIQRKMKQLYQKNISHYLRNMALCGLVLVVDDEAYIFLLAILKRLSKQINEIAKLANRTGELNPSDMESLFENICHVWYAVARIQYEVMKQQKEVEETQSNEYRIITFHPRRFPKKKRSVALHCRLSQDEYAYIQKKKLRTCPTVSEYVRQTAVYGFSYDFSKVSSYLPEIFSFGLSIGSNFNQILRVIGEEDEEQEKYNFNVAYNIPNVKNKVRDICRLLKSLQFELR